MLDLTNATSNVQVLSLRTIVISYVRKYCFRILIDLEIREMNSRNGLPLILKNDDKVSEVIASYEFFL